MLENKIYYTIGEVADEFNVTFATLRYWETQFSNLKPDKNKRGVRLYRKQDVEVIKKILFLTRQKGYSIAGAKKEFAKQRINGDEEEVLQTLLETKELLLQLKELLK